MKIVIMFSIVLVFLIAGCNTQAQENKGAGNPLLFSINENSKGFCVMTSTSDFRGKIQYAEAEDGFLMLDNLFSEEIACSADADCYEFLLDQDDYRSMAPEFEPYLNCESASITEINFKS